ncbi:MAG TPA: hypothetical protein VFX98_04975 [Longimicrobiaceae bacterium]|nr:hypothetical protein [Longimicrobiaceae bacterium]
MSPLLGGIGIGAVWGWWAVLVLRGAPRAGRSLLALAAALLLAGAALRALTGGWSAVLGFGAAAAAMAWVHGAWLQSLRQQLAEGGPR